MTWRWSVWVVWLAAFASLGVRPSAAVETRFKVSLGYHYSSGTYGTSSSTNIDYVPLIAKAGIGAWTVQGTFPYLRITGPPGFASRRVDERHPRRQRAEGVGE